mmetsp:Transcript_30912/g.22499  ORF Transcript_30912/g.22499 Transcript_30912/m.22499 type:complete len:201 (-) Transcript_30912:399-1001(-)
MTLHSLLLAPSLIILTSALSLPYALIVHLYVPPSFNNFASSSGMTSPAPSYFMRSSTQTIPYRLFLVNLVSFRAVLFTLLGFMCISFFEIVSARLLSEQGYIDLVVGVIMCASLVVTAITIVATMAKIRTYRPYNMRFAGFLVLFTGYIMGIYPRKATVTLVPLMVGLAYGLFMITGAPDVIAGTERAIRLRNIIDKRPN